MEPDSTNQQIPPQAPLPNPPNHPKILIIITSVILLTTIGVGSYVLGTRKNQATIQNQQVTSSPTISQPTPTLTETPFVHPTTDPSITANWKTYINTKYRYSIKYPPDWLIKECPEFPDCGQNDETTYINSPENIGQGPEPLQYYLYIGPYTYELPKDFTFTEELINNNNVFRTTNFPSRSGAETVLFKRNDHDYISVGFTPYDNKDPFPQQERFYKTFDQILTTFKFTP